MITTKQAIDGLIRYIDSRIIPSMPHGKAIMLGGTVLLMSQRPDACEEYALQKAPFLADIGIFKDGMWDIDALYNAYAPQIKGRFDVPIPMVGNISLDREEADILYRSMQ